jgi:hypothetical protein
MDVPRYRTLKESLEFSAQFDAIVEKHSLSVIGPVLDGLLWGIASGPKGYDRVTWNIRVAKNQVFGLTVPRLRIFFGIESEDEADEHVLLLWIEEIGASDDLGEPLP